LLDLDAFLFGSIEWRSIEKYGVDAYC
jgi:hypothetical protein